MNSKSTFRFTIILLLCAFCFNGIAQDACQPPDNQQAVDLYKKGTDKKKYQKEQRVAFLKQCLEAEPDYVDANFAYAEEIIKTAILNQSPFAPAVLYFLKVIKQCPHYHSDPYYYVGFSYYEDEKYKDAVTYLQKFLSFKDDDEKKFSKDYDGFLYEAKKMLKYAKFYSDIFDNPVPFDPYPVKNICTERNEYLAAISPDNTRAYFTRKLPHHSQDQVFAAEDEMKEYFMESTMQADGTFTAGTQMPPPFNKGQNEGGPSVTIDNKVLYFTICKDEGGAKLNCDIYFCNYASDGKWGEIQNMGQQVNDPSAWDSQPSVSADGLTLYFASEREGGMGKADIYKTEKNPTTGEWSGAINMGAPINTPGNDKTPFIHSDSHTLYFSSDGHMGIGGYDIFYSRIDSTGKNWQEPTNIGYPINSAGDDLGFFVSTDGKTGYFCSNDPNRTSGRSVGGYDLFQFGLYLKARPEHVALRKGKINTPDGDTKGVTISVKDAVTNKPGSVIYDTVTGEYTMVSTTKNPSIMTIKKKGFSFASTLITAKDTFKGAPQVENIEIKPIAAGMHYPLNNIYYKTNSTLIEPVSLAVIQEFVKFLKEYPTIKIKIAGYTDNVGNETDNLALSKDRAFTVMQAIEKDGITAGRLSFSGNGSANPVASNDTEEGRQKNRRTEFVITEK